MSRSLTASVAARAVVDRVWIVTATVSSHSKDFILFEEERAGNQNANVACCNNGGDCGLFHHHHAWDSLQRTLTGFEF
jgi:hypothetical protein